MVLVTEEPSGTVSYKNRIESGAPLFGGPEESGNPLQRLAQGLRSLGPELILRNHPGDGRRLPGALFPPGGDAQHLGLLTHEHQQGLFLQGLGAVLVGAQMHHADNHGQGATGGNF
jgi:hypothetical protein